MQQAFLLHRLTTDAYSFKKPDVSLIYFHLRSIPNLCCLVCDTPVSVSCTFDFLGHILCLKLRDFLRPRLFLETPHTSPGFFPPCFAATATSRPASLDAQFYCRSGVFCYLYVKNVNIFIDMFRLLYTVLMG